MFIHSSSSIAVDAYITESYDNGVSFLPPLRVSTQSSDPNNAAWTHHYHGTFNTNGANSYCVWTDYRNGNADIYFSKVNPAPLAPVDFHITGGIGEHPTLHWAPNIEFDLDGYKIYSSHNQGAWNLLTTVDKNTTSFTDPGVTLTGGKFDPSVCYNISAIDLAGNESEQFWRPRCVTAGIISKEVVSDNQKDSHFSFYLSEAYPNPFNPVTQIKYSIVDNGIVTLKIYDVLGREIATLVNEEKAAGNYEVRFDASQLSSGIYLYTLQVGNFTQTRKMILLK